MRLLVVILIALVGLIQYPLWLGKGGWFRVWALQTQVAEQRDINEGLRARNAALAAEVQDLQTGTGALEERARGDLGMIREGEIFVHILPHDAKPPAGASASPGAAPAQAGSTHSPASAAPRSGAPAASPAAGTGRQPASGTSGSGTSRATGSSVPAAGSPAARTPAAGSAARTPAARSPGGGSSTARTPATGTPAAGTPAAGSPAPTSPGAR